MILIADSGSTKTDWALASGGRVMGRLQTAGINPFHQSADVITGILAEARAVLVGQGLLTDEGSPLSAVGCHQPGSGATLTVAFYGSGVRPELKPLVTRLIEGVFRHATVEVEGDLLGAARALCGTSEGIACILGTGANSCLYDGTAICRNTPPLGYILGDEGSGAVLGRRLINLLYKGGARASLVAEFERATALTLADVVERVYRQPMANRFLASLSPFVSNHLDEPALRALVVSNFRDFFRFNLQQYRRTDLPVGFVGSMAAVYTEQLAEAAQAEGFGLGRVLRSPVEGLLSYHALCS